MSSPEMDTATLDQPKERTARLPVLSSTGLVLMKFVVGFTIGPVRIISEAIHSSMDLITAVIAFFPLPGQWREQPEKRPEKCSCTQSIKKPLRTFFGKTHQPYPINTAGD